MKEFKIPERKGFYESEIPGGREIRHVQRIGGYWYVSRKFPFLHFEKERLLIFTDKSIMEVTL